jgi:hypothetical protein
MIVRRVSSLWAVVGLMSRCGLSTVYTLVCWAVPLNVSDEVASYTFRGGVDDPGLVRGAPYAVWELMHALEGMVPALEMFEPSWIILDPLELGEPVLFHSPVDCV